MTTAVVPQQRGARKTARRVVGIVRVSETKGREGDSFVSPTEQSDRIRAECDRLGLGLVEVIDERDVSGRTPLVRREGLRRAIEAIEAGRAEVVMGAYFDRLMRSLPVQAELVARVEKAGGEVLALDTGAITNGSAGQWLSGTLLGAVAEYQSRTAAERSGEAQARAVARGVVPFPNVPPGYMIASDDDPEAGIVKGQAVPDPKLAPVVAETFRMRAAGATLAEVRRHLVDHGIRRSYHGVGALLESRFVLGEIHFGRLENLTAHEPIVPRDVWQAVQRVTIPRGRRAKSDRLLARLGVLRCGTCGARMVVANSRPYGKGTTPYYMYRCPPNGDCSRRVTISAEIAERVVVDAVKAALADVEGRASAESNVREAEVALVRAQENLDAAFRAFGGFEDEPAARERLADLRAARDQAQAHVDHLSGSKVALSISAARDWDRLALTERRALIRAVVGRVLVTPSGRGAERITVELLSE